MNDKEVIINWEMECKKLTEEITALQNEISTSREKFDSLTAQYSILNNKLKVTRSDLELAQGTIANKNIDVMNLKNDMRKQELEIKELRVYKRFYEDFHYAVMK